MDQHTLALLIPIMALAIPVAAIVFSGLTKLARAKREAIESQIGSGSGVQGQIDELRSELQDVRHELTETQERLDFAERMLAQQREKPRLEDR